MRISLNVADSVFLKTEGNKIASTHVGLHGVEWNFGAQPFYMIHSYCFSCHFAESKSWKGYPGLVAWRVENRTWENGRRRHREAGTWHVPNYFNCPSLYRNGLTPEGLLPASKNWFSLIASCGSPLRACSSLPELVKIHTRASIVHWNLTGKRISSCEWWNSVRLGFMKCMYFCKCWGIWIWIFLIRSDCK